MGLIGPLSEPTTPGRESVFSCSGVSLQLVGRQILDDVNLSVAPGESQADAVAREDLPLPRLRITMSLDQPHGGVVYSPSA